MLVLSRKIGESVVIDGHITVKIVRIEGDQIRLGIQAPSDVPVHRQEVYEEIQRSNREAALNEIRPPLPRLASRPVKSAPASAPAPLPAPATPPASPLSRPAQNESH